MILKHITCIILKKKIKYKQFEYLSNSSLTCEKDKCRKLNVLFERIWPKHSVSLLGGKNF